MSTPIVARCGDIAGSSVATAKFAIDFGTERELCSSFVLSGGEPIMFRAIVEEAAALASLALFLGMIAIWAQVIATL